MIENFYPNPIVVQRLQAGPLSAHIDTFAQQLFDEGYALWTVKYSVRLLADLTTWMQQQGLTITDLAEQPVHTFFQNRYQIRCPHRDDQSILNKLLAYLRTEGIIVALMLISVKESNWNCNQGPIVALSNLSFNGYSPRALATAR